MNTFLFEGFYNTALVGAFTKIGIIRTQGFHIDYLIHGILRLLPFLKLSSFEAIRTSVPPTYLGVDPAVPLSPGNE